MANLFNLLFVLLCLSSVALASRENRVSETANALKKRYNSFPSCNQMICWPYIAKCNLFGACGCEFNDLKTCGSCCKKCEKCLRNRWNYCCECLKMCPPLNATGSQNAVMSTSGDLKDSIPSLFEALSYGSKLPFVFVNHRSVSQGNGATANATSRPTTCKVGFFRDCSTLNGCEDACHEVGASRYRWFHNGCCECIGDKCKDYGKTEPLCKKCPT